MKKNLQLRFITTTIVSLFVIFFFLVQLILSHEKTFSDKEMRVLQTMPALSYNRFVNGSFQKEMQSFLNDQFYQRSSWVAGKTYLEQQLGKQQFQDVYIGKDGYLFQKIVHPSKDKVKDLTLSIDAFVKENKTVSYAFLLVPNKASVMTEQVPSTLAGENQKKDIASFYKQLPKEVKTMDALTVLEKEKKQQLYYRSDHHWTIDGAYTVFKAYEEQFLKKEKQTYQRHLVNDSFYGTLANTSAYYKGKSDQIYIYEPIKKLPVSVNYIEEQKKSATVYAFDKASTTHPYEVYLDGNHPMIQIETAAKNEKHLLLLKDSFANCFVPFLLPYYHKITIIDPRYYYDDIYKFMKNDRVSDVLFLYNANTFFGDTSLEEVLHK